MLTERLELADELLARRAEMLDPQDLPGRYRRLVVKAVDHLLQALDCPSVLGGGWAVWRHGYVGRVTQDLDIVLPAGRIDEFLRAASEAGFGVLSVQPGRWPRILHPDTGMWRWTSCRRGGRPGPGWREPAPTTIPHPSRDGRGGGIDITIHEFAIADRAETGRRPRGRDESDVVGADPCRPGSA